ncbi:MAG TPA: MlaD family protein [Baekduia sp.]|nr:MlaD family protein [Baekduia sp.]
MRRRRASIAANPVLVGAITTLVTITAVFLAYNANAGLPFVPTYEFKILAPSGARLVPGNEVREGGERIGQVSDLEVVRLPDGRQEAELTVQIDKSASPLPEDTKALIRPRSTLGLKYVDLVRGSSAAELEQGETIRISDEALAPELDQFFSMFDEPTRENVQTNLTTAGNAFANRGADLNRTLAALPQLLGDLVPVMRALSDEDTGLREFFAELGDAARIARPVADDLVAGFRAGADVFEAFSRDGGRPLRDTIAETPATLQAGITSFRAQRPLLRGLANISDELRTVAAEIDRGAPTLSRALLAGRRVLPDTPPFNERLGRSLESLRVLASEPATNLTLAGLGSTLQTLNPTLRWVGPHVTVCNYWNYWWTYLSDHINEQVPSGTLQRIQVKLAPGFQPNSVASFGAIAPANGGSVEEPGSELVGQPAYAHAQPYGRAVDEQGNADCESGQRGYPIRATNEDVVPKNFLVATSPRTPGNQGPTFTGKPKVPPGQTFAPEPEGLAPKVVVP